MRERGMRGCAYPGTTQTTPRPYFMSLFTQVRGREILRTSVYRVLRSPCGSAPMAVLPTGRVGYASPAVGSGGRGEVLSWSPRYGDGTARPAAYTGGEAPSAGNERSVG